MFFFFLSIPSEFSKENENKILIPSIKIRIYIHNLSNAVYYFYIILKNKRGSEPNWHGFLFLSNVGHACLKNEEQDKC